MTEMTFTEATIEAMREEMRRDPLVFAIGEDMALQGGVFGQFKGLPEEFGVHRVLDTPISETSIVGAAVGAALCGARPVVDMHFADFIATAMDEVVSQAAKARYMFGGQCSVPMVLRMPDGAINSAAAHHSASVEAWLLHTPGVKLVVPSTPADAKGLLKSAIRDDDPVLYFEHKSLFKTRGEVPDDEDLLVPLGSAAVRRPGQDVTILSYSQMVHRCLEAAERLAEEGISAEVIDLRSLRPLDWDAIADSVRKTHRVVVAHEAVRTGGVGAELAAEIGEELFDELDGPVIRVAAKDVPMPFSPPLERFVLPGPDQVVAAVRRLVT
ncbi:MAG TPA: alpha-ketoacid dehydrogenase subunit beta [Chloroflexota bacterium]|nr:alpha-ketoacid dehydrogenase subunit beta [Chloroflexota bacterium]